MIIANNNNDNNFVYFMAGRNRKTLIFIGKKCQLQRKGGRRRDAMERSERGQAAVHNACHQVKLRPASLGFSSQIETAD